MQGLAALMSNPVLQDGVAGLACTATAFAAVEVRSRVVCSSLRLDNAVRPGPHVDVFQCLTVPCLLCSIVCAT